MVLDAIERIFEELERVGNPRELTLLAIALVMVAFGAVSVPSDPISVAMISIGSGMFFIGIFLPALTEFQIGPGGFSAKLRERDEEMQATLEPHAESLMRAAALLAGDSAAGRKMLEQALVETYVSWRQAKQEGPTEAVIGRLEQLAPAPVVEAAAASGEIV